MAPFKVVHPAWLQRQVDLIQQVLGLAVLGPARKTGSKAVLNRDTKSENHVRKKQKVARMCTRGVLTCPWIAQVVKPSALERILWMEYCCPHYSSYKEVKAGRPKGTH